MIPPLLPRYCHANPSLHHDDPHGLTLTSLSLESLRRELMPVLGSHTRETSEAVTITGHRLMQQLNGSLHEHFLHQNKGLVKINNWKFLDVDTTYFKRSEFPFV